MRRDENLPILKNPAKECQRITKFVENNVKKTGGATAVVGISGGIDSAVVNKIIEKTKGIKGIAVFMPEDSTPEKDVEDVNLIFEKNENKLITIEIDGTVSEIKKSLPELDKLSLANVKARARMTYLYGMANITNGMVVGTGNLTEWLLGYFTKFGDGAADISPIRHLFKTEVKDLAKWLNIPKSVIDKPPSAGLWENQTDEEELGGTYKEIDRIIYSHRTLLKTGKDLKEKWPSQEDLIDSVLNRIEANRHKRKSSPALSRK